MKSRSRDGLAAKGLLDRYKVSLFKSSLIFRMVHDSVSFARRLSCTDFYGEVILKFCKKNQIMIKFPKQPPKVIRNTCLSRIKGFYPDLQHFISMANC